MDDESTHDDLWTRNPKTDSVLLGKLFSLIHMRHCWQLLLILVYLIWLYQSS